MFIPLQGDKIKEQRINRRGLKKFFLPLFTQVDVLQLFQMKFNKMKSGISIVQKKLFREKPVKNDI